MDIVNVDKKIQEIVKEAEPFLRIAAEEIMSKFNDFCIEYDIHPKDEEYTSIMNLGAFHAQFMFGLPLTIEKLKYQTKQHRDDSLDID